MITQKGKKTFNQNVVTVFIQIVLSRHSSLMVNTLQIIIINLFVHISVREASIGNASGREMPFGNVFGRRNMRWGSARREYIRRGCA